MPNNDLPVTVDEIQNPAGTSDAPQSTTAPETEVSAEATPALDLRCYELSERLGGGGMGDVYRSGDPALGRDLAVKVMKADLQGYAAAEQRFVREARVTGSLQHPGIVPIYNLGRLSDGRLHYTMRLVRGCTFADILKEEAGQPERLPALLTIFEKICQAVAYAHSKQVLHRDLKPANVMVGRFGEVQVMDWGLAKALTAKDDPAAAEGTADMVGTGIDSNAEETPPELTQLGRGMGTPAYMPPEQALGEWGSVDERADVFALGAILCQILTGQPLYRGGNLLQKAQRGDCAEALARLENCGADAALRRLCRDCLAQEREHRPRDAEQVAQRVAAYQNEVQERLRQVELERVAAVVQARWERKKRRWILAFVLLLSAAAAISGWLAVAERQAKNLAQTRLGQNEKAIDVLTSIFTDLDPTAEQKGGPILRLQLSQHLERAAVQLDEDAVGDAVAVARLQTVLGKSLTNLGQTPQAIEVLSKAERTLQAKLGPDHPQTLNCRNNLAVAYLDAGRIADAVRLHEQTLAQFEATLGADHPDTLVSRNNLAVAYLPAGRITDAIRLHEENLKRREATLGADHPDTLATRNNLATAYRDAGRTADAIRLHEQTLRQKEAKLGADHPDTLISRNNLANAYWSAGRAADAIPLYEQTLKQQELKLGIDHRDTLTSRNNLAVAYRRVGRFDDAIRQHEQTLKLREAKLGPDHGDALQSRGNLAGVYRAVGRTDEAIRMYEQILKQREAKLGADHPNTLTSRNNLASAYRDVGRTADAIRLHEKTLKQLEVKLGLDHPKTLASRNNLAAAYWAAGRTTQAIPLFERTLKQRDAKLGADHPDTLATRHNLAVVYQSVGRSADAILLHQRNLKQREAKLGPNHPDTLYSMASLGVTLRDAGQPKDAVPLLESANEIGSKRTGGMPASLAWVPGALAQTYERAGQFAKAEAIFRDSLAQAQRQFGPDDPRTSNALAQLGDNLLKQKRYSDAAPLLRQCLTIREKKQPDAWDAFNTRSALGEALLSQKKYSDAEPLLVQGYEGMKQRQDKIPPPIRQLRLSEALERLVRLYEATNRKEMAADWRRKLQQTKAAQKENKP